MVESSKAPLSGLTRKLIQLGHFNEEQAHVANEKSIKDRTPLINFLSNLGNLTPLKLAHVLCHEFGMPLIDLNAIDLSKLPEALPKYETQVKLRAIPIFLKASKLVVAISDPTNLNAIEEIQFETRLNVEAVLVENDKLNLFLEKINSSNDLASLGDLKDLNLDSFELSSSEEESKDPAEAAEDEPLVRFVKKVLIDAINKGASDIHFEPYEKIFRIRFRQDGMLYEYIQPPLNLVSRIISRLKVISQLDISERRLPQDGRFKLMLSRSRSIDFRVSTCPTLFGEKIVMRILDPSSAQLGIDALGYEPMQKQAFLECLKKPQGLILVTGPTGSGKTVSLYTAVNILNTDDSNISTCEDPVEINLPGINQVNINTRTGLTFSVALRAFLRQDPDIIMVGEIRDLDTAEIAVKAAQTGHLVLSTLHTNSAADTLTRLINMGIPAYNLATSVTLVIAQRLIRKLCPLKSS